MRDQMEEQRERYNCLMVRLPHKKSKAASGEVLFVGIWFLFYGSTISQLAVCPVFTLFSCNREFPDSEKERPRKEKVYPIRAFTHLGAKSWAS